MCERVVCVNELCVCVTKLCVCDKVLCVEELCAHQMSCAWFNVVGLD